MKILRVSTKGICPPSAKLVEGKFYALHHGEEGRGRWEVRFPLPSREFPPREGTLPLDGDYSLVDLHRADQRGNPLQKKIRFSWTGNIPSLTYTRKINGETPCICWPKEKKTGNSSFFFPSPPDSGGVLLTGQRGELRSFVPGRKHRVTRAVWAAQIARSSLWRVRAESLGRGPAGCTVPQAGGLPCSTGQSGRSLRRTNAR